MPDRGVGPPKAEVPESKYANYFNVGHNAFEFVMEFAQLYSEQAGERVHTRIVTSPVYAKEFFGVLGEAVQAYERSFGPIPKKE
jgi:hypothetical protein